MGFICGSKSVEAEWTHKPRLTWAKQIGKFITMNEEHYTLRGPAPVTDQGFLKKLILSSKVIFRLCRNYLKQRREETSGRLLSRAYWSNGPFNKWWLAFAKRRFVDVIVTCGA
ncbi:Actin-related protein 2/3 complex subunit 3 [Dendrobium catenatum]|uniref:Actin-related protein 2/3 complex subunit 3 n=1 Tax=Dendrobium catenatum TaxID=906689 RepID=A0A2I0XDC2_9ASPA|nr:Actin-related protein 2/3 complex subunit 3 [Dendrobium catenatum]